MVSIFAEEILEDTRTFSVTDGDLFNNFDETFTVTSTLSEFVYVEDVSISASSTDISVNDLSGSNNSGSFRVQADFLFNNVEIGNTPTVGLSGGSGLTTSPVTFQINDDGSVVTSDSYLDSPLDIRYRLTTSNTNNRDMEFDGTQTFDITVAFALIGRTP